MDKLYFIHRNVISNIQSLKAFKYFLIQNATRKVIDAYIPPPLFLYIYFTFTYQTLQEEEENKKHISKKFKKMYIRKFSRRGHEED